MADAVPNKRTMLDVALDYRLNGYPVFPCNPLNKRPMVKSEEEGRGGVHMATTDEGQIRTWWAEWPNAMVGLPTGEVSGLFVIDLDVDKDTGETIGQNTAESLGIIEALSAGIKAQTPSGGTHYYFRDPGNLGNSASKIGPKIDTRGNGGYVVAPGSITAEGGAYAWDMLGIIEVGHDGLREVPDCLLAMLQPKTATTHEQKPSDIFSQINTGSHASPAPGTTPDQAWALAALNEEVAAVAGASQGQRNHQLNASAFSLGQIVAGGLLREEDVRGWMRHAAQQSGLWAEDGPHQCEATISSGLESGKLQPRRPEPKSEPAKAFDHSTPIQLLSNSDSTLIPDSQDGPESAWKIQSAADFIADFVAPEYVVEGIIQRGRLYTLTAPTGHGKTAAMLYMASHIAAGRDICGQEVERGSVLFLAGENPDDVRARVIAALEAYDMDAGALDLHFIAGTFSIRESLQILAAEAAKLPDLMMIVVDTFAAYFDGDNENDNAQALDFARMVRRLTALESKPCVVMPAHPIKNATRSNLVPKGGSSLLNEVDGNLTIWNEDQLLTMHWQGKHRGVDFEPLQMEVSKYETANLRDKHGRLMPTVVAKPVLQLRAMEIAGKTIDVETGILRSIDDQPALPQRERAAQLHLSKSAMDRAIQRMLKRKWLRKKGRKLALTDQGKEALSDGQAGIAAVESDD